MRNIFKTRYKILLIILTVLLVGITGGFLISQKVKIPTKKAVISYPRDKYLAFLSEVYDKIKENYWNKITDEQLTNIFILGTEKLTGKSQPKKPKDRASLQKMLSLVLKEQKTEEKKKEFSTQLADLVLANLEPFNRSRLYSQKQEISLKNTVENKNPDVDQYKTLNVSKDASAEEIKKAFDEKTAILKREDTPQAKQELAQAEKTYQMLSDQASRQIYDQSGVEPTMEYKVLTPSIFYLHLTKFSPTTMEELLRVTDKFNGKENLSVLILDLRGNIGGAIDGLPYFLGPFIGNDQYAYQFYQQGNKEDFKTKIGWFQGLVQYKQVVVLIDGESQSTAEVMAAAIKRYNTGILVGTTTKGWGTVEKVYELSHQIDPVEKFSIFLVHHLTLREDGQPIEGRGVEPVVNINDPNWDKLLFSYFHNQQLIEELKKLLKSPS